MNKTNTKNKIKRRFWNDYKFWDDDCDKGEERAANNDYDSSTTHGDLRILFSIFYSTIRQQLSIYILFCII